MSVIELDHIGVNIVDDVVAATTVFLNNPGKYVGKNLSIKWKRQHPETQEEIKFDKLIQNCVINKLNVTHRTTQNDSAANDYIQLSSKDEIVTMQIVSSKAVTLFTKPPYLFFADLNPEILFHETIQITAGYNDVYLYRGTKIIYIPKYTPNEPNIEIVIDKLTESEKTDMMQEYHRIKAQIEQTNQTRQQEIATNKEARVKEQQEDANASKILSEEKKTLIKEIYKYMENTKLTPIYKDNNDAIQKINALEPTENESMKSEQNKKHENAIRVVRTEFGKIKETINRATIDEVQKLNREFSAATIAEKELIWNTILSGNLKGGRRKQRKSKKSKKTQRRRKTRRSK